MPGKLSTALDVKRAHEAVFWVVFFLAAGLGSGSVWEPDLRIIKDALPRLN